MYNYTDKDVSIRALQLFRLQNNQSWQFEGVKGAVHYRGIGEFRPYIEWTNSIFLNYQVNCRLFQKYRFFLMLFNLTRWLAYKIVSKNSKIIYSKPIYR